MFTAVAQKNLGDAESYFDEHLSQNDYYAAGEIRPGQWIGMGAERLGLKSEVTREQFHALCENQNPETGELLPAHYASADEPSLRDRTWIEQQWDAARLKARDSKTGALLVLD
ncbi:MAG: relaxase domain-containing protein, partial [Verrucomicrobiota bacterium]